MNISNYNSHSMRHVYCIWSAASKGTRCKDHKNEPIKIFNLTYQGETFKIRRED